MLHRIVEKAITLFLYLQYKIGDEMTFSLWRSGHV